MKFPAALAAGLLCALPLAASAEVDRIEGDELFEAEDFARATVIAVDEARTLHRLEVFLDCPGEVVDVGVWHLVVAGGNAFSLRWSSSSVVPADGWVGADADFALEAGETYAVGVQADGPCSYEWGTGLQPNAVSWGDHLGGLARNQVTTIPSTLDGPPAPTVYTVVLDTDPATADDDDAADDDDSAVLGDDDDDDDASPGCGSGCSQSPASPHCALLALLLLPLLRRR